MIRVLMFGLLVTAVFSCRQPQRTSVGPPSVFHGQRTVFLGNSITQNGTYVSMIAYYLAKQFPADSFELVSVGLSSETVSGLSEAGHPFPRPNLHERLDRVLEHLKPSLIFACYGMNDGIYAPLDSVRFKAYQQGIDRLREKAGAAPAALVLLTPPMFDTLPLLSKIHHDSQRGFGYAAPYAGYNSEVLRVYRDWIMKLPHKTVDIYTVMNQETRTQRQTNASFTLSPDGIHPSPSGHLLMAETILKEMNVPFTPVPLDSLMADTLYKLVDARRQIMSQAWLEHIGYVREDTVSRADIQPALEQADGLSREIKTLLQAGQRMN